MYLWRFRMTRAFKDYVCEGASQDPPAVCHRGNFQLRLNKHLHWHSKDVLICPSSCFILDIYWENTGIVFPTMHFSSLSSPIGPISKTLPLNLLSLNAPSHTHQVHPDFSDPLNYDAQRTCFLVTYCKTASFHSKKVSPSSDTILSRQEPAAHPYKWKQARKKNWSFDHIWNL